ncbi:MAG: DUF58 domain-containing protein [Owenweeksia sp.]|nr:DUF58 domain-containing protein [Owenweeksia sp.]
MLQSLYLTNRFFTTLGLAVFLLLLGYILPEISSLGYVVVLALLLLVAADVFLVYRFRKGVFARRETGEKLSNGDANPVDIYVENFYPHHLNLLIIDEVPVQFQRRDVQFQLNLPAGATRSLHYELRPVKRGAYHFGAVNVLASTALGLVRRRYRFGREVTLPVYPSFVQMRQYELLAISNELTLAGIKKIRRIGSSREFEQIEKYVTGDDYRRINWKATARRGHLMVNHYQAERSQQVYSVIDKGRAMKMPFEELSLLDYTINASLVISSIALRKGDKPGLITFQHKISSLVPASGRNRQLQLIMEQLYQEKTAYYESSFKSLYTALRRKLNQRCLLLLYTNFESLHALERQLPYLQLINRQHLLVVVFFENTEVEKLTRQPAKGLEDIYVKGIAEQLLYEKRLMVKKLKAHGIHSVLTPPQQLNVNTINKYLELKARGLI